MIHPRCFKCPYNKKYRGAGTAACLGRGSLADRCSRNTARRLAKVFPGFCSATIPYRSQTKGCSATPARAAGTALRAPAAIRSSPNTEGRVVFPYDPMMKASTNAYLSDDIFSTNARTTGFKPGLPSLQAGSLPTQLPEPG